jgi:GNAT superfamily N-acetyltransferase
MRGIQPIRRANKEDSDAVARLAGELGYPVGAKKMRRRIQVILASAADLLVVAADSSGAVIGWLQAHAAHIVESGFRVEITGLVVSEAFRRRGVGRALVAEAENWARTMAAEAVVVRSNARRAESHSFYPALGYAVAKMQTVYRKTIIKAGSNPAARNQTVTAKRTAVPFSRRSSRNR